MKIFNSWRQNYCWQIHLQTDLVLPLTSACAVTNSRINKGLKYAGFCGYEEFCLLCIPLNIIDVSELSLYLLYASFMLVFFFDPEDGDDMFLRNVGWLSTDYTALYSTRSTPQKFIIYLFNGCHYNSVGFVTDYEQDDLGLIPNRARVFFMNSTASRPALELISPPVKWVSEPIFQEVKRQGCKTDHSPPFSAEVNNSGAISPFPHTPSRNCAFTYNLVA
jgi:hypothetical protein